MLSDDLPQVWHQDDPRVEIFPGVAKLVSGRFDTSAEQVLLLRQKSSEL